MLASQVTGLVEDINELSPVLADLYAVLRKGQIDLINERCRLIATTPGYSPRSWRQRRFADPAAIVVRDLRIAQQGALIYKPPLPISSFVSAIAARESRDMVSNIRVLDEIASTPAPITTTM